MPYRRLSSALVVPLLLMGACSGDDEPLNTGGGGGETTATPTDESPAPTETLPPSSTVEPASGLRLELSAISANAPKGWTKDPLATDYQVAALHPELVTSLYLLEVPDPSNGAGGVQLTARQSIDAAAWLQKPKILEPTEIDGVEVYHIAGRVDSASFIEEYGTTVNGQAVRIRLHMTEIMSPKERKELVESVLPTVQFG